MAVNAVLATIKLVTGIVGHSYALVADAVESFADIASSTIVWGSLIVSAKPPDAKHPYGHGKAESLAALAVGFMLSGAAFGIAVQAIDGIRNPHEAPAGFTLIVLIAVVIAKETMCRVSARVAKQSGSLVVAADAWHHRADAITSMVATVGISISLFAGRGYESADDWAALVASVIIMVNGIHFVRRAMGELMDEQPAADLLAHIESVASSVEGVRRIEKIMARKTGTKYLVDAHVEVDGDLPVRQAHSIAHRVKDRLREQIPSIVDVLVHIEPVRASAYDDL